MKIQKKLGNINMDFVRKAEKKNKVRAKMHRYTKTGVCIYRKLQGRIKFPINPPSAWKNVKIGRGEDIIKGSI